LQNVWQRSQGRQVIGKGQMVWIKRILSIRGIRIIWPFLIRALAPRRRHHL